MNTAVVGLGSNIKPQENIKRAKELLAKKHSVVSESDFRKTKPIGRINQDDFINGVLLIETPLKLNQFKQSLKRIEKTLGRKRTLNKFGARTIDLDVLVWNERIVHKDFNEREFVRTAVLKILPRLSA